MNQLAGPLYWGGALAIWGRILQGIPHFRQSIDWINSIEDIYG
jgi:hypothetical protein